MFKNIPLYLRSPYWTEHGAYLRNATVIEKIVSNYAFIEENEERPRSEILFNYKYYFTTRDQFATLSNGEVENTILDIFALRLTLLNVKRAVREPKRMFFSSRPYEQLQPTIDYMKAVPVERKKQNFFERIHYELSNMSNLDINDADLIFFPVLQHGHFFIICINVPRSTVDIIDNRTLLKGMKISDKYGQSTNILLTAFREYIAKENSPLFWKVKTMKEELIKMSWRGKDNTTDCGIYVMRHMETYKGSIEHWAPRFRKAHPNSDFINELRAKYAANIITWNVNTVKDEVLKKAKELHNKK